jgi:glycosyltransferase involved in cell wall biosynthesis
MKLLSIVTINRNNAAGLEKTLRSVAAQADRHLWEYVVIDGASTDGSVDLLHRYADLMDFSLSEPDRGIYNAMNKALAHVHGLYVLFLNSGDTFAAPDVVRQIAAQGLTADVAFGRWQTVDNQGHSHVAGPATPISLYDLQYDSRICHQATLTRTDVLRQSGGYDERYRISADACFLMRALVLERKTQQLLPVVIADYDTTGVSATHDATIADEHRRCFADLFPALVADYETMHRWRRFYPHNIVRHLRWRWQQWRR